MFTNFNTRIRKALYGSLLLLGIVFAVSGIDLPASADPGAQQALSPVAVANDDFDNALIVTTIPYSNTQDIMDATVAADDPVFTCASGQRYNTVWYRYTPSVAEDLIFSTWGSEYSTVLAVWTGTRGSLTSRACSTGSQVQLAVSAGTMYYIELARDADEIIPPPTSMNVVFSVWPADTYPSAFNKSTPANGAAYQSIRPILGWGKSTYAVNYAYCYDTSDNSSCDTSWITTTSTTANLSGLSLGTTYYWQARAANTAGMTYANGGAWWSFTTASADDLNHWIGTVSGTTRPTTFDVLTDGTQWLNFSVSVAYQGCSGGEKTTTLVTGGPGTITQRSFSYNNASNSFWFSGTFDSTTTAMGSYHLSNYPICDWTYPGYCCWASTTTSGTWTASGPALPESLLYLPLALKNDGP